MAGYAGLIACAASMPSKSGPRPPARHHDHLAQEGPRSAGPPPAGTGRPHRRAAAAFAGATVVALAGATVAALAGAGSALATTPTPVTIEVITASPAGGTFTTSGAGLCPSGTTTDQNFGTGGQSGFHANFHDRKTFTCADGSGTFTANVQAHLIFGAPADSFTWNILSGTGAYAKLRAKGDRAAAARIAAEALATARALGAAPLAADLEALIRRGRLAAGPAPDQAPVATGRGRMFTDVH